MVTVTPDNFSPGPRGILKDTRSNDSVSNEASVRLRASLPPIKEEAGTKRKGDPSTSPRRESSEEKRVRLNEEVFQTASDHMLQGQQSDEDHRTAVEVQAAIDADDPIVPMQGFYPSARSGAGSSTDHVSGAAAVDGAAIDFD